MPYTYDYPRPAVCTDCVILGAPDAEDHQPLHTALGVLLIQRNREPFAGTWALPGGFVEIDEPLEVAAYRELREETGLEPAALQPLGIYGAPGRDPRGRTISAVYTTVVRRGDAQIIAGDDAGEAAWFPAAEPPALAFDHAEILGDARRFWAEYLMHRPFGRNLIGPTFTLAELRQLYEIVLGRALPGRAFSRWIRDSGVVERARESEQHRAKTRTRRATYCFRVELYRQYQQAGFVPPPFR